jgi:general secretion pathway protein N
MRRGSALIAVGLMLIVVQATAEERAPPAGALPWLKLDELSATRERPLFAPDRRSAPPPPPPVAAPVVSAPEKEEAQEAGQSLSLRGIIQQGATTLIVLEDTASATSIVVRSGESYGRWRVSVESDDSVKLADGSQELRLRLFEP